MNKKQTHILHHTLGYREDQRLVARNYFYTGVGSKDYPCCEELVALGFFTKRRDTLDEVGENYVYHATDAGRMYAKAVSISSRLGKGLQEITEIENKTEGGDWDEIEEAREIARKALRNIGEPKTLTKNLP